MLKVLMAPYKLKPSVEISVEIFEEFQLSWIQGVITVKNNPLPIGLTYNFPS